MRAPAASLAALEVAVRGRGAALARAQDVGVHAEAHRAARHAPVEAGLAEDLVEALGLGLRLDLLGAGHDHRVDARRDLAPVDDLGGGAQVADARVRARADEHAVERDLLDRRAGLRGHVVRARVRSPRGRRGCRTPRARARCSVTRAHHPGVRAPRHLRRDRASRRSTTSLSNSAPSSLRSSRQRSIASSSSSPRGAPGRSAAR